MEAETVKECQNLKDIEARLELATKIRKKFVLSHLFQAVNDESHRLLQDELAAKEKELQAELTEKLKNAKKLFTQKVREETLRIQTEHEQTSGKSRSGATGTDKCAICFGRDCTATIVHGETGHNCTCMKCARLLKASSMPCPLCR